MNKEDLTPEELSNHFVKDSSIEEKEIDGKVYARKSWTVPSTFEKFCEEVKVIKLDDDSFSILLPTMEKNEQGLPRAGSTPEEVKQLFWEEIQEAYKQIGLEGSVTFLDANDE